MIVDVYQAIGPFLISHSISIKIDLYLACIWTTFGMALIPLPWHPAAHAHDALRSPRRPGRCNAVQGDDDFNGSSVESRHPKFGRLVWLVPDGSRWFQMVPGSRLNLNCWIEEPRWWCGPVPSIPNTVIQISRSYSITSIYIRTVQLLNRPLWIFWQHFGRVNLWAANCQHSKSCCCQWPLMLVCKMSNETYIPSGNLT
jgi:hypothetical protein